MSNKSKKVLYASFALFCAMGCMVESTQTNGFELLLAYTGSALLTISGVGAISTFNED